MPETLDRSKQKFLRGDMVRVADKLPSNMNHFAGRGELAIVAGSYDDRYPGMGADNRKDFTLFFPTLEGAAYGSTISWYREELMALVKPRCLKHLDILDGVRKEKFGRRVNA